MSVRTLDAGVRMITTPVLALVLLCVACSASAQILLKYGMAQPAVQASIEAGGGLALVIAIVLGVAVPAGLALYALSALGWLFVLARLDVSIAYPFVGLGFIATMLLGCALFGEPLTLRKVLGTLAVVLGVWLVGGSR